MSFPFAPFPLVNTSVAGSTAITSGGTFVVPAGVTTLEVTLRGAGGGGGNGNAGATGGRGGDGAGVYQAELAVTPGETLNMSGGIGGSAPSGTGSTAAFRRGTTNLMTAAAGTGGSSATKDPDSPTYYPGTPGTPGSTGTGGTVTAGGGASGGAGGPINGAGLPGSNGSTLIAWIIP